MKENQSREIWKYFPHCFNYEFPREFNADRIWILDYPSFGFPLPITHSFFFFFLKFRFERQPVYRSFDIT